MAYDYIKNDLAGYPFNEKYPPNYEKNGGLYHGYRNNIEETFYYDFAVQRYDLRFRYDGKEYYFFSFEDHAAQCDETFSTEIKTFKDGNDVIEHFQIDGKRLIDIIPLVDNCEAV